MAKAKAKAKPKSKATAAPGAAAASDSQTALQRAIERQSQLQLMIKTSGSAMLWAENMRRLKIVIIFVWFGFWAFLDSFLSIGHRVSHLLSLPHRSAAHDVIVIEGALAEGLVSAFIGVAVGLLIVRGLNVIDLGQPSAPARRFAE